MTLSMDFVKGLTVGLEYDDLDEEDAQMFGGDVSIMVVLSLGFIRFLLVK